FLCAIAWSLNEVFDRKAKNEFSTGMRQFFARVVESDPSPEEGLRRAMKYRENNPIFTAYMWVITDNGRVLASNTELAPPEDWNSIEKPEQIHSVVQEGDLSAIRLNSQETRYLVWQSRDPSIFIKDQWAKMRWIFLVCTLTGTAALSVLLLYLRRKS